MKPMFDFSEVDRIFKDESLTKWVKMDLADRMNDACPVQFQETIDRIVAKVRASYCLPGGNFFLNQERGETLRITGLAHTKKGWFIECGERRFHVHKSTAAASNVHYRLTRHELSIRDGDNPWHLKMLDKFMPHERLICSVGNIINFNITVREVVNPQPLEILPL